MKTNYEKPSFLVIMLNYQDIITSSTDNGFDEHANKDTQVDDVWGKEGETL